MIRFVPENSKINNNSFFGLFQLRIQHMDYDNLDTIPPKDIVFVCDYPGTELIVEKSRKFYRENDKISTIPFEYIHTITAKNVIIVSNRGNFQPPEFPKQTRVHVICVGPCNNYIEFEKIAEKYNGVYNYITTGDELSVAIGSIIGAVFSTMYRNASITFNSNTLLFSKNNEICQSISVGDLYADENKDILIKCHRVKNNDIHCVEYTFRAINALTNTLVEWKKKRFINEGIGRPNMNVINRWKEICIAKELKSYNTDVSSNCYNLQGDIEMLTNSKDPALFRRVSHEYLRQRDNRSDDYVSKYYTPFRMWLSRELSKS
tara:strand:+ start:2558 stop:3514 length:957 start_codon:yes stop_codon:yes gene_type:complete